VSPSPFRASPSERRPPSVALRSSPSERRPPSVALRASPSERRPPSVALRASPSERRPPSVALRASPSNGDAVGALEGVPETAVGERVEVLVTEAEEELDWVPATMVGEGVGALWWKRQWDCWQECSGSQWRKRWQRCLEKKRDCW
jgi:hypothetical protein